MKHQLSVLETHLVTGTHQALKKEVEKLKLVLAKLPDRQQVKKSFWTSHLLPGRVGGKTEPNRTRIERSTVESMGESWEFWGHVTEMLCLPAAIVLPLAIIFCQWSGNWNLFYWSDFRKKEKRNFDSMFTWKRQASICVFENGPFKLE